MYNESPSYFTRRNAIRLLTILVVLAIIVFIGLHGFLSIKDFSSDKTFSYSSYDTSLEVSSGGAHGPFNLLASGQYSIEIPTQDGGISSRLVNVPYFFQSASTSKKSSESKVDVIARGVPSRLATTATGIVGWDESGIITPLNSEVIDNSTSKGRGSVSLPGFDQSIQVNGRYIGGVVKIGDEYLPSYFDFQTNSGQAYEPIESTRPLFTRRESTGFSLYDQNTKTVRLYDPSKTSPISIRIDDTLSTYDTVPLYSKGISRTVIVTGGDIHTTNEDKNVDKPTADIAIAVVDDKTKKVITKKGFGHMQLENILLSPDGSYIYLQTNQSMAIYRVNDFERMYAAPYAISQFMWLPRGSNFAFTTFDKGLFIGSVTAKSADTVVPYSVIQPSLLSYSDDSYLYFTAYSQRTKGAVNPDAYRVSIKEDAGEINTKVLRELPYQGEDFYVDYINGRLVVQLTKYVYSNGSSVSEDARNRAIRYVEGTLGLNGSDITYVYSVSDLRAAASTDE